MRSVIAAMKQRPVDAGILLLASLLPFLRLGIGEIQPWDESLYAIRANACLAFGAWLDQTHYAIGHFYSATHPPLGVWLIALSKLVLGDSTFAVRFPMALAASTSVLMLYAVVNRLASRAAALVSAASLAASSLFVLYSHRAQLESLVLCFGLATIVFLLFALDKRSLPMLGLSGVALALGLLSKFIVVLYVAPLLLLLPYVRCKNALWWYPLITLLAGCALSLPWLLYMLSQHPDFLQHIQESLGGLQSGTYARSSAAWWYYVNQLVVSIPLLILALGYFLTNTREGSAGSSEAEISSRRLTRSLVLWLILLLGVLQLVGTRMPHFAFLLILPGAMLAGVSWDKYTLLSRSQRVIIGSLALVLIGWSSSEQLRLVVTARMHWDEVVLPSAYIMMLIFAGAITSIYLTFGGRIKATNSNSGSWAHGVVVLILTGAALHPLTQQEAVFTNGARPISQILQMQTGKVRAVIIHPDFPHEQFAPQFAYYTAGWTLGWLPNKSSDTLTYERAIASYVPDSSQDVAVVTHFTDRFHHPDRQEVGTLAVLDERLRRAFLRRTILRSYTIYY